MAKNKNTPQIPEGYQPLVITVETITPAQAREMLGFNYDNRNQRKAAISGYARDLANGNWLVTGDPIRFDWTGKLIDGQHRLEACILADTPLTTVVIRNLSPAVQGVIDANVRRSAADALKWAGVTVQTKDIAATSRVYQAYVDGHLKTAMDHMSKFQRTHSETLEWVEQNPDVLQAVAFANRFSRALGTTNAALGAAALILLRLDSDAAIEFFTSAAEMRTNGTGDPRKAMVDAFTKIRSREHRAPLPAESLAIIFRAWNAYRSGTDLQIIRRGASNGRGGVTGVSIPEPM